MQYLDDNIYIDRILEGDVSAYENLVNKHKDLVFTIALKISRNREDAEEIAQDTFVKVYQKLSTFKKASRFSTWIYRIAYNTAISKIRAKRPESANLEDGIIENLEIEDARQAINDLEENEQKMLIQKVLDRLPEEENLLITLYYMNGKSIEEISEITNLSRSNVKVKLHRIRKKLYAELQRVMENEFRILA